MEILVEDIPDEGLEIMADLSDPWFASMMRDAVGKAFEPKDVASLKVALTRFDGNVNLDGVLEFTSHPDCDRCLIHFKEQSRLPFHVVLAPLFESQRQRDDEGSAEEELVKEDMEFAYYEGDRFDLAEIIREQIVLADPMKRLCKEGCLGLCPRCGKDLNEGSCDCAEKKSDPRWAPLKDWGKS